MSKELPLVVEYRIADLGSLSFYLAPKVHICLPASYLPTVTPGVHQQHVVIRARPSLFHQPAVVARMVCRMQVDDDEEME